MHTHAARYRGVQRVSPTSRPPEVGERRKSKTLPPDTRARILRELKRHKNGGALMNLTDGGHIILQTEDREPFAKVPARVLRARELSAGARLLYAILTWLGWREAWQGKPGYAGQEALAEEFGLSTRSIRRYMNELQDQGYIRLEHVGLGQPANVTILPLPELEQSSELEPDQASQPS